jgi:hypothetical protein
MDIVLVSLKPLYILLDKGITLPSILNPGDAGEKCAQVFTGIRFGIGPEPAHPFPLDVIQTPLEDYFRPDHFYCPGDRTLTVSGDESWVQSLTLKCVKPGIGFLKGFLLNVFVSYDLLVYAIHQIQQTTFLMKVGGIVKQILYSGIIDVVFGRLFKPIVLNAIKCKSAIAREVLKLPDGVALSNP